MVPTPMHPIVLRCPSVTLSGEPSAPLLASVDLLAAVGGDRMLEVDAYPDPLRDVMAGSLPALWAGRMAVLQDSAVSRWPQAFTTSRYRFGTK